MNIRLPLQEEDIKKLKAGDMITLSGILYTARDQAHARLVQLIEEGRDLPIPLQDQVIYYTGPTPARPGAVIGSAGPTTSYRMDTYTPLLLKYGLKGMIGKGGRSREVREAIKEYKAVYFAVVGGAAALIARSIKKAELVAYPELGPEAIRRLEVENFPVIVINDIYGNDLYEEGQKEYRKINI
ncbi:MAG TPA: Fe-S-containing hydro-lyase [Halanaerobiales bacterium]|nr:Fe-S-containing hydro-lyase [Halanaerobiales bacterium]HPZ62408.1 Fe-S-containing hydro-lyase [Halanaerobiales bacterium]HQD03806.1 Fe-S-containing hydro-lyase [Halanaerobiales bacterium]